jgi:glucose dehydrogenase (acceptor)
MKPHGTLRDGLRCSTAKAFLRPALDRSNLHISLRSTVLKVGPLYWHCKAAQLGGALT